MATTLHEWICQCGNKEWSRVKPPKMNQFIYRAAMCRKCRRPMRLGTGNTQKRYSLRELL
jgi:hypothetical protein